MSSVEIEANVGSISSRSALNMRLVKVALRPGDELRDPTLRATIPWSVS